jgi:hypothetical protein
MKRPGTRLLAVPLAKLDRLSRNAGFLLTLLDSGVEVLLGLGDVRELAFESFGNASMKRPSRLAQMRV